MRDAAATMLAMLPHGAAGTTAYDWRGQSGMVGPGFVAGLFISFGAIGPGLAGRAGKQILDDPKTFEMDTILVPAARDKLRAPDHAGQPAVARLRAVCLAHLRARIALPLEPPADWQRSSAVGCRCRRCGELSLFLADGTQK